MESKTFNYTGSSQTWEAPTSQTITVILNGAGGGSGANTAFDGSGGSGGSGGYVEVEVSVERGETLELYIPESGGSGGQYGSTGSGGWGYKNGGSGGVVDDNAGGGGGGGAAAILDENGNLIATAGGGGGGGAGGEETYGNDGGGGGGGARGGTGGLGGNDGYSNGNGQDAEGSGKGGDGGQGGSDTGENGQPGEEGGSVVKQGTEITSTVGGGNQGNGQIEILYEPPPVTSDLSNEVSATTVLAAPSIGEPTFDSGAVVVPWTNNDNSSDGGIDIERSSDGGASWSSVSTGLSPSTKDYSDSTVSQGKTYEYRIERNTDHATATSGTATVKTFLPITIDGEKVVDVTVDGVSVSSISFDGSSLF